MNAKQLSLELSRFLRTEDPEVLCISGKWGVGKTYTWNHYLKNAKENRRIKLKRYAYVSLFGLKTLNDFKYALYEATKPVGDIGEELQWDDFNPENTSNLDLKNIRDKFERPVRRIFSFLTNIPLLQNYIGISDSILFYTVRNQLICIDDLERAGSGLDVLDVFGLVSFLKEERKCRVVL